MSAFAVLRCLASPLVALAVVLTVLATVMPVVAKADGTLCIAMVGGLAPEARVQPACDHCLPAAAEPPAGPALAPAAPPAVPAVALAERDVLGRRAARHRIRGPPGPPS